MAGVHDLDHVKVGLDPPSSSNQKKSIVDSDKSQGLSTVNRLTAFNKTNHKLEYYLTLIRSSKPGGGLIKLIEDSLSSDGVYVFGEILESPAVLGLAENPKYSSYLDLLKIFAYGTWRQYRDKDRRNTLPKLNPAQTRKLKQLTIATRASQSKIIPYSDLLELLEISNIQELEELIIDAIYSDLIEAKLDQKSSHVEIESFMGRDVELNFSSKKKTGDDLEMEDEENQKKITNEDCFKSNMNVVELRDRVQVWFDSIGGVIDQLDEYIESVKSSELESDKLEKSKNELIKHVLESLPSSAHITNKEARHHQLSHRKHSSKFGGKDKKSIDDQQMFLQNGGKSISSSKARKRTRP